MAEIKKRFIVNENNEPVEVILDVATFNRIQELLEDHFLSELLDEAEKEELLTLEQAKRQYRRTKKKPAKKG
jgi:hypothetical protein